MNAALKCIRLALAVLAVFGITTAPNVARAQTKTTIHISITDTDGLTAFIAQDLGLFQAAGLDVDIQQLHRGAVVISAIVAGQLQIGIGNPLTLAVAHEKGVPLMVVAPGSLYVSNDPTTELVGTPDTTVKSGKDLDGKTVAAASIGGMDMLALKSWIDTTGGNSANVQFIELLGSEMTPALEQHRIAAASLTDPTLTAVRSRLHVIAKSMDAIAPSFMQTVWFANTGWSRQNHGVVAAFAKAMEDAAKFANDPKNHARVADIVAKHKDTVTAGNVHIFRYATGSDYHLLQPLLDAAYKYKMLPKQISVAELTSAS